MNFWKLKKVFGDILVSLVLSFTITSPAIASPAVVDRPAGAKLVLADRCKIDFIASTYWTGSAEDLVAQVAWLVGQLPTDCLENDQEDVYYCVFTNIDPFSYNRLRTVRFMEGLNPEYAEMFVETFRQCRIAVNTPISIIEKRNGVICITGNKFVLTVSGNNNSVTSLQKGCNVAYVTIVGDNVNVVIQQNGNNSTWLTFVGSNISMNLTQNGNSTYVGNFTGGENITIVKDS